MLHAVQCANYFRHTVENPLYSEAFRWKGKLPYNGSYRKGSSSPKNLTKFCTLLQNLLICPSNIDIFVLVVNLPYALNMSGLKMKFMMNLLMQWI